MRINYKNFKKRIRLGLVLTILVIGLTLPTLMVGSDENDEVSFASADITPDETIVTTYDSEDYSPPLFIPPDYGTYEMEIISGPSHNSPTIIIYVNDTLWLSGGTDLQNRITRLRSDIEDSTGIGVGITNYISGSPEDIKTYFNSVADLVGCVLIGNIPSAWYQMFHDPEWSGNYSEFPIDLYYMDLDGAWHDIYNRTDEYGIQYGGWGAPIPPGPDGIYDGHTGDVEPEIWIGRIKANDMHDGSGGSLLDEADLVNNYLDKNHNYRTGSLSLPQKALAYVDDDWTPGAGLRDDVKKAFPTTTTLVDDKDTTVQANYLASLSDGGGWSLVHLRCHGSPTGHRFKHLVNGGSGYEGPRTYWYDYKDGDYPIFFYSLFVCSGGRFTDPDYLAGWCIFADTYGLAAISSTKTGGMRNDGAFYTPLGSGDTLGESFKQWYIVEAEVSRPWYYGMTVLGDPTLGISGKHSVTIDTPGLNSATGVVHYVENSILKHEDIAGGTWSGLCDHGSTLSIDFSVEISSTERYYSCDTSIWTVAEPITHTVTYHHQFKPTIYTSGLPVSAKATVSSKYCGASAMDPNVWDGNLFNNWCDEGTTVDISNPVVVIPSQERYSSTDMTSWPVSSAFTATVNYYHQFYVTCEVTTAGVGHTDLDPSNSVEITYTQSGSTSNEDIYDGHDLDDWMDAGTPYIFENPSESSDGTHRWYTPSSTSYTASSSTTTSLTYYEQFLMTVTSSGNLLTPTYYGTTNYLNCTKPSTGTYWDNPGNTPWSDWCDIGSTLTASEIVMGPSPDERYHTSYTTSWMVSGTATYNLLYHKEYKITIMADGLLATLSTEITIDTANPSPSDDTSGGDISPCVIILNAGNGFSWTNWVHADTDLTALTPIEVSQNEKYILICWTKDLVRDDPPTVTADTKTITYTAQYVGLKKEMSLDDADLCDSIMVTIEVSNPSTGTSSDTVEVVDDLPNELSYVVGSAEIDGVPYPLIADIALTPEKHQQLTFTVNGFGKHTITFEVKVNRAYATDHTVENMVGATFVFVDIPSVELDVLFPVIIHPYNGPSLSKSTDGPEIVPLFTEESWVFTYIVKNNYEYMMKNPLLKDHFGAELDYDVDTVIANLLSDPVFTYSKGKAKQLRLEWTLPDITIGEAFMLQVTVHTKTNPGGDQTFTEPGEHILNSGANLKWFNERNKKQSMTTETISVTAVGQIYGYVKDQDDAGVEGVIVEIYYDSEFITTAQTDSSGQYNCAEELTDSGVYTVKITGLPDGYEFGCGPSEKTATYNVGQLDPTEVNFEIQQT